MRSKRRRPMLSRLIPTVPVAIAVALAASCASVSRSAEWQPHRAHQLTRRRRQQTGPRRRPRSRIHRSSSPAKESRSARRARSPDTPRLRRTEQLRRTGGDRRGRPRDRPGTMAGEPQGVAIRRPVSSHGLDIAHHRVGRRDREMAANGGSVGPQQVGKRCETVRDGGGFRAHTWCPLDARNMRMTFAISRKAS